MSITLSKTGSLFEVDADAIVNAVNCVGVMGKGLALEFKQRFPANFRAYSSYCAQGKLKPGEIFSFTEEESDGKKIHILNLATKDHWRDKSRLDWIEKGADSLRDWSNKNQVKKIACPALGAGLGGLPWEEVQEILMKKLQDSSIDIVIFSPKEAPKTHKSYYPR